MVWIHGGAFIFGGINKYSPEYILEEDVVLVTIQYRLNVFGFLSTEDSTAPGNYGMLDQVQALKWIQENIAAFGGDPDQVTIFGMSAGGASVHYLTLSPLTGHLYKNAISLSGSALCWWANVPHPRQKAVKLATHFDCAMKSSQAMLDCLRKIPTEKLHQAHYDLFFHWHKNSVEREPMNVFSPRSDPEAGPEAFLPLHPYKAMEQGLFHTQPHMMGFTDKEGIWRANQLLPDGTERSIRTWRDFAANFTQVAPWALGLFGNQCKNPEEMVKKIQAFYGLQNLNQDDPVTEDLAHKIIDVLSDSMFSYAIDETVRLTAKKKKNIYYHYYTFSGAHSLANLALDDSIRRPPIKALRRASHGSDMLHLLKLVDFEPMSRQDLEFSRKLVKFVIDWGKKGTPPEYVSDWTAFNSDTPSYLIIDQEFQVTNGYPDEERLKFWRHNLDSVYWNYVLEGNTLHDEL